LDTAWACKIGVGGVGPAPTPSAGANVSVAITPSTSPPVGRQLTVKTGFQSAGASDEA
jgi:hypothetical protein